MAGSDGGGREATGSLQEVFAAFLKLGFTSFGGPIAHLGYFRNEFVVRRRWVDEAGFADLVALAQFLPGPASSQVGFALGLKRGGWAGAAAAWVAFTFPSAALMVLFAAVQPALSSPTVASAIHGLKLVAVAIVAQAVVGMARSLCPDLPRAAIAILALAALLLLDGAAVQVAVITAGSAAGWWFCRSGAPDVPPEGERMPVSKRTGLALLAGTVGGLILLPALSAATDLRSLALFDSFYRAGALVFGGGHVVLPLLEAETVRSGWIDAADFVAGYGAVQAMPGPLFTFAAYLGAAMETEPNGLAGAAICLMAIFLPGLLLMTGTLPFWAALRGSGGAQAAVRGTNAAVVGLLAAALYDPVWTSAVAGWLDALLAGFGFALLTLFRTPPLVVIVAMVAATAGLSVAWPPS